MMISSSYSYSANEDRKFKAIYGSKDYIIEELQGNPISLGENYPNPFSETTIIPFAIYGDQEEYQYTINIYSMDGKLVTNVINDNGPSGSYAIEWDGRDKNGKRFSGLFIYSLEVMTNEGIKSFRKKMILH